MKINSFSFLFILVVLVFASPCFSQEKEFKTSWDINISSGQSFIDYFDGFETAGLSYSYNQNAEKTEHVLISAGYKID